MLCGYRLWFCVPSESLYFTLNPGLYMPMSPCSPPNCLIFTPFLSYELVPLSAVWGAKLGGGGGGFEWVSSRRCARCDFGAKYLVRQAQSQPNTQSGSRVRKGIGGRPPRRTLEYNLATMIAIRPERFLKFRFGASDLWCLEIGNTSFYVLWQS